MSGWNQLNEKRADIITDSANERYMSSAYLAQWTRQGIPTGIPVAVAVLPSSVDVRRI